MLEIKNIELDRAVLKTLLSKIELSNLISGKIDLYDENYNLKKGSQADVDKFDKEIEVTTELYYSNLKKLNDAFEVDSLDFANYLSTEITKRTKNSYIYETIRNKDASVIIVIPREKKALNEDEKLKDKSTLFISVNPLNYKGKPKHSILNTTQCVNGADGKAVYTVPTVAVTNEDLVSIYGEVDERYNAEYIAESAEDYVGRMERKIKVPEIESEQA